MRTIHTTRFGSIEIAEDRIIQFEQGLLGFESERQFALIPYEEKSPFVFLQSARSAHLAFLVTNPFLFFPDYAFEIDDDSLAELEILREEETLIYSLITMPDQDVKHMTTNLLAPVVINQINRKAKQIILDKSKYKTKHRLFQEMSKDNSAKEDR